MRELGGPSQVGAWRDDEEYNSADEYDHHQPTQAELSELEENERAFEERMKRRGFSIKRVRQDGSCLFRAVSQHVYGDEEMHDHVRALCVDHLSKEREFFARYVTEDFEHYLARKRQPQTFGNHVEMHAMSEMYARPIHVYCYSDEPINTFQPEGCEGLPPICLSYHNRNHFNALIDLDAPSVGVGLGLPAYQPSADRQRELKHAQAASEGEHVEQLLLAASAAESERAAIEEEMERAALAASALGANGGSASAFERGEYTSDVLPPIVSQLVGMGYDEARVVQAYTVFGDDHASLLTYLMDAGE